VVLQIGGERITAVTFDAEWGDLFSEALATAQSFCDSGSKFATWTPWDGERAACLDLALAAYQITEELCDEAYCTDGAPWYVTARTRYGRGLGFGRNTKERTRAAAAAAVLDELRLSAPEKDPRLVPDELLPSSPLWLQALVHARRPGRIVPEGVTVPQLDWPPKLPRQLLSAARNTEHPVTRENSIARAMRAEQTTDGNGRPLIPLPPFYASPYRRGKVPAKKLLAIWCFCCTCANATAVGGDRSSGAELSSGLVARDPFVLDSHLNDAYRVRRSDALRGFELWLGDRTDVPPDRVPCRPS
jgi:hypothetical protein